jgi:hypothetical protein
MDAQSYDELLLEIFTPEEMATLRRIRKAYAGRLPPGVKR